MDNRNNQNISEFIYHSESNTISCMIAHTASQAYAISRINALFKYLEKNPNVTSLEIINSPIVNYFSVLCDNLKNNRTLTSLHLNFCGLDLNDATTLAQSLINNKTITHLNLANNYIGNYPTDDDYYYDPETIYRNSHYFDLIQLIKTLEKTAIISLNLDGNDIKSYAARGLSYALKSNNTLLELSLNNNLIDWCSVLYEFNNRLQHNQTLLSLKLENNSFIREKDKTFLQESMNEIRNIHTKLERNAITTFKKITLPFFLLSQFNLPSELKTMIYQFYMALDKKFLPVTNLLIQQNINNRSHINNQLEFVNNQKMAGELKMLGLFKAPTDQNIFPLQPRQTTYIRLMYALFRDIRLLREKYDAVIIKSHINNLHNAVDEIIKAETSSEHHTAYHLTQIILLLMKTKDSLEKVIDSSNQKHVNAILQALNKMINMTINKSKMDIEILKKDKVFSESIESNLSFS